jgi:hypothetical protein
MAVLAYPLCGSAAPATPRSIAGSYAAFTAGFRAAGWGCVAFGSICQRPTPQAFIPRVRGWARISAIYGVTDYHRFFVSKVFLIRAATWRNLPNFSLQSVGHIFSLGPK